MRSTDNAAMAHASQPSESPLLVTCSQGSSWHSLHRLLQSGYVASPQATLQQVLLHLKADEGSRPFLNDKCYFCLVLHPSDGCIAWNQDSHLRMGSENPRRMCFMIRMQKCVATVQMKAHRPAASMSQSAEIMQVDR